MLLQKGARIFLTDRVDPDPWLLKQKNVFNAFYSNYVDGAGLGLMICKKIVDAHSGFMTVESKGPGLGRMISFSIPLQPVSITQAAQ